MTCNYHELLLCALTPTQQASDDPSGQSQHHMTWLWGLQGLLLKRLFGGYRAMLSVYWGCIGVPFSAPSHRVAAASQSSLYLDAHETQSLLTTRLSTLL